MLTSSVPPSDPKLKNQDEQLNPNDKFYQELYKNQEYLLIHHLYHGFCFLVFFGILKFTLLLFCFAIWYLFVLIMPLFKNFFELKSKFKMFCYGIARNLIHLILFCLGIISVKINGNIEPKVRIFVSNHVSPLDYIIHFYGNLVTFTKIGSPSSFAKNLFTPIFDIFQFKDKKLSYQIHNCASDPTLSPLLIFPEGKETNGNAIGAFKKEVFKTDYLIQPISIQYHLHLTPRGFNTVYLGNDSYLYFFFRLLSIPFITVELTYLSPLEIKYCQLDIDAKAQRAQLQIANQIGVLAISKQEAIVKN